MWTNTTDDSRFSPISEYDHAGILWITALLSGTYFVLSLLTRIYIKITKWWQDDWVCIFATAFGLASVISVCVGLSNGLGKASFLLDIDCLHIAGKSIFANQIFLIVTLVLAKCSVILLMKRCLAPNMFRQMSICNAVMVVAIVWGLGAIIGISADCSPSQMLSSPEHCSNQPRRWQAISAFDAATELLIVLLSTMLIWRLKIDAEKRIRVVISFTFRLLLIPVIALHALYISKAYDAQVDLPFAITAAVVCEQVLIGYSLISATVPNLKAFIKSFNSEMMMDISHKLNRSKGPDSSGTSSGSSQGPPQPRYHDADIEEQPLNTLPRTPRAPLVTMRTPRRIRSSQKTPSQHLQVQKTIDSSHDFNFFGTQEEEEEPQEKSAP